MKNLKEYDKKVDELRKQYGEIDIKLKRLSKRLGYLQELQEEERIVYEDWRKNFDEVTESVRNVAEERNNIKEAILNAQEQKRVEATNNYVAFVQEQMTFVMNISRKENLAVADMEEYQDLLKLLEIRKTTNVHEPLVFVGNYMFVNENQLEETRALLDRMIATRNERGLKTEEIKDEQEPEKEVEKASVKGKRLEKSKRGKSKKIAPKEKDKPTDLEKLEPKEKEESNSKLQELNARVIEYLTKEIARLEKKNKGKKPVVPASNSKMILESDIEEYEALQSIYALITEDKDIEVELVDGIIYVDKEKIEELKGYINKTKYFTGVYQKGLQVEHNLELIDELQKYLDELEGDWNKIKGTNVPTATTDNDISVLPKDVDEYNYIYRMIEILGDTRGVLSDVRGIACVKKKLMPEFQELLAKTKYFKDKLPRNEANELKIKEYQAQLKELEAAGLKKKEASLVRALKTLIDILTTSIDATDLVPFEGVMIDSSLLKKYKNALLKVQKAPKVEPKVEEEIEGQIALDMSNTAPLNAEDTEPVREEPTVVNATEEKVVEAPEHDADMEAKAILKRIQYGDKELDTLLSDVNTLLNPERREEKHEKPKSRLAIEDEDPEVANILKRVLSGEDPLKDVLDKAQEMPKGEAPKMPSRKEKSAQEAAEDAKIKAIIDSVMARDKDEISKLLEGIDLDNIPEPVDVSQLRVGEGATEEELSEPLGVKLRKLGKTALEFFRNSWKPIKAEGIDNANEQGISIRNTIGRGAKNITDRIDAYIYSTQIGSKSVLPRSLTNTTSLPVNGNDGAKIGKDDIASNPGLIIYDGAIPKQMAEMRRIKDNINEMIKIVSYAKSQDPYASFDNDQYQIYNLRFKLNYIEEDLANKYAKGYFSDLAAKDSEVKKTYRDLVYGLICFDLDNCESLEQAEKAILRISNIEIEDLITLLEQQRASVKSEQDRMVLEKRIDDFKRLVVEPSKKKKSGFFRK